MHTAGSDGSGGLDPLLLTCCLSALSHLLCPSGAEQLLQHQACSAIEPLPWLFLLPTTPFSRVHTTGFTLYSGLRSLLSLPVRSAVNTAIRNPSSQLS